MKDIKKLELHLHLEGAAPPEFIRRLAQEKHHDLSGIFNEEGGYRYKDFWDFLKVYEAATEVLQTPDDFNRLTQEVLSISRDNGVIYTEVFLSPDFCGGRDLSAWRDYLAAIQEASSRVDGIDMRAVVTCVRHFGPEAAKESALCAAETSGDFVLGFGMGGDERAYKPKEFAWAYACAREAGLGLTAHAGEWDGPSSVRQAWKDLGLSRIGHGVRVIEDARLIDELIEADVTLEVCPGSNVALGLYPRLKDHPIAKLRDHGLKVTVSTDDPPFFQTTMACEYERLAKVFGWNETDWKTLALTAIDAAYCSFETKARLKEEIAP